MMKRLESTFNTLYNNKNSLFKTILLIILSIFTLHICIPHMLPSAFSITIEEQAKKGVKKETPVHMDELIKKTPERRDYERSRHEMDPRLACLLSLIIPGGGHIYLRKDLTGIGIFMSTLVGYSFAGYYLYVGLDDDASDTEKKSKLVISGLLFTVAIIVHIVGIVEAYNDAIEINEERFYFGAQKSKSPYIARLVSE